jgi:hypothetical protein
MIVDLISRSIRDIEQFRDNDDYIDWIYFIERLKTKGVQGDLQPVLRNIKDKSSYVSRTILDNMIDDREKFIITMI